MKSTWLFVLALAVALVGLPGLADDSSAQPEFPSVGEILRTVEAPDYSVDRFISDTQLMFSPAMIKEMFGYGGDLVGFLFHETFLGEIFTGGVVEAFTGDTNYINYFVLACLIIAAICVVGAFLSYYHNRDTYFRFRDE